MSNINGVGNRSSRAAHFYYCANGLNGLHNQIISSLNVLIAITSFPVNLLIIVALQKITSIHPPSKLLFSCLALTDLCVGIILQPLYIAYLLSPYHSSLCYYLEYVSPVVALSLCGVSLLTSTAISVDRLFALVLGLRYRQTVTRKRVWAFVIFSWLGSSSNAVVYLYGYRILLFTASAMMLLCISTSSFCYLKIYRILRHHQFQVQERVYLSRPNRREVPINIARYRKTVSSALWISLVLLGCYLPFVIMIFIEYITYAPIVALFFELAVTLVQLNSSLNPLLYCWKIRDVRQVVKDMVKEFFCSQT